MDETKRTILGWMGQDRQTLIDFLEGSYKRKAPTYRAIHGKRRIMSAVFWTLADILINPRAELPNLVGHFQSDRPGWRLVLNGHSDVFPVGEEPWAYDPRSGTIDNGRIYGRGACDMKHGTTASVFAFTYLHRLRKDILGQV